MKNLFVFYSCLLLALSNANASPMKNIGSNVDEMAVYESSKEPDSSGPRKKGLKFFKEKIDKPSTDEFFVVARINKDVITNVDVINAIKFLFFSSNKKYDPEKSRVIAETIVFQMIEAKLQEQYSKFYKIKIDEKEIDDRVSQIASENNMSVSELASKFDELGINMDIFKKNMKSKMLLHFIFEAMHDSWSPSENDIAEEKAKAQKELQQNRYHIYEIFFKVSDVADKERVLQNAKAVHSLLLDGFSFQALAEATSQGQYTGAIGDRGWVVDGALEPSVKSVVSAMEIDDFSDIIETRNGYKIVYLLDKALPNKGGVSDTKYKVVQSSIEYQGKLITEADIKKAEAAIDELSNATTLQKYKDICNKYSIKFEEKEISTPTEYEFELITRCKKSGKASFLQSNDDENLINVLFVSEYILSDAKVPTDAEIAQRLVAKRVFEEFRKNVQKLKAATITRLYRDKVGKIFK